MVFVQSGGEGHSPHGVRCLPASSGVGKNIVNSEKAPGHNPLAKGSPVGESRLKAVTTIDEYQAKRYPLPMPTQLLGTRHHGNDLLVETGLTDSATKFTQGIHLTEIINEGLIMEGFTHLMLF